MPVNSKAQVSLVSVATDKWGAEHKITKAFVEFSTGDGINVNTQTEMAQLVVDNLDDLCAALKIEWGKYGKLAR